MSPLHHHRGSAALRKSCNLTAHQPGAHAWPLSRCTVALSRLVRVPWCPGRWLGGEEPSRRAQQSWGLTCWLHQPLQQLHGPGGSSPSAVGRARWEGIRLLCLLPAEMATHLTTLHRHPHGPPLGPGLASTPSQSSRPGDLRSSESRGCTAVMKNGGHWPGNRCKQQPGSRRMQHRGGRCRQEPATVQWTGCLRPWHKSTARGRLPAWGGPGRAVTALTICWTYSRTR